MVHPDASAHPSGAPADDGPVPRPPSNDGPTSSASATDGAPADGRAPSAPATGGPAPSEISDVAMLKAFTHPRRQAILQRLSVHGPATSAMLARDLGWNTGATSYHLRELARYGLVEELPERAHGRERWWRHVPRDLRFPRRSQQTPELRAIIDEMNHLGFAADLEAFATMQAEADHAGAWGDAFPFSRGAIRVTLPELAAFFEEYIALLKRYQRPADDAADDRRVVLTRFLAFPAPLDAPTPTDPDSPTG